MKNCFKNIAFCLLFTANVFAQINPDGYIRVNHPNTDRVAYEGMMRDGKQEGNWKTFHVTGVLRSEGNYVNGLLDSTWVFYTQTGDTAEILNYRLGKKSGYRYLYETVPQRNQVSTHYLKLKELYLDNKLEGLATLYYPNGNIRQTINHRDGKRHGISRIYDENGTVITVERYHNGHMNERETINRVNEKGEKIGVWKTFYPSGAVMEEEFYKNGVLDGPTLVYSEKTGNIISGRTFSDGKIVEEGAPIRAEPINLITYWEDEVTKRREGLYLDSIPIGYHYFYNSSGVPEKVVRYNDNGIRIGEGPVDGNSRLTGEYRTFYETGELRTVAIYVNNVPNGEITFFFRNGSKEQIGYLNNNVREGKWTWYFPSGNIHREEILVNGQLHGLSIQYSDSATIVAKGEYVEGEREGFWIEHVGHIREEGNYIKGEKQGMWRSYYLDGQPYHTGNFEQGVPNGRHLFYFPDGKTIKEEQHYVMGRRNGNWKKYYENGAPFLTITYYYDNEVRINGIRID